MNWTTFKQSLRTMPETDNNPELHLEQAERFSSVSKDSTEIEFLDLLHDLVRVTHAQRLLETGTGKGISTAALAFALLEKAARGLPVSLLSVDSDAEAVSEAQRFVDGAALRDIVEVRHTDSLSFISSTTDVAPFDFVFFDSSRRIRVKEFLSLEAKRLIISGSLLAFHDTSPGWDTPGTAEYVKRYLVELQDVRARCHEVLTLPLSRGLTIFRL